MVFPIKKTIEKVISLGKTKSPSVMTYTSCCDMEVQRLIQEGVSMKSTFRKQLALLMAILFAFGCTIPAMAADVRESNEVGMYAIVPPDSPNANNFPYHNTGLVTTTSWQTVASSTSGFNCYVRIVCLNTSGSATDVKMLGKNNNYVWSENGAVANGTSRDFWCGSDVYVIQVRTQSGLGSTYAYHVIPN